MPTVSSTVSNIKIKRWVRNNRRSGIRERHHLLMHVSCGGTISRKGLTSIAGALYCIGRRAMAFDAIVAKASLIICSGHIYFIRRLLTTNDLIKQKQKWVMLSARCGRLGLIQRVATLVAKTILKSSYTVRTRLSKVFVKISNRIA